MSQSHDPDLRETDEAPVVPVKEPRELNPFVIMQRGMGTVDPSDDNRVIFEDYSPRVVPSDAPDDDDFELDIPSIPKGLSVLAPADSSVSSETTEPQSEPPVSPVSTEDPLPFPMPELPSPAVEQDAGKRNRRANG